MSARAKSHPIVYLYVLGSSSDPDSVQCAVPWLVDEQEIFFGPCKVNLRKRLRDTVLGAAEERVPSSDIYVAGINAMPASGVRKIVWAGKITRVMTFARAHESLVGPRYEAMRRDASSPLHVEPIFDDAGRRIGYRHRPNGHHPGDWENDLLGRGDRATRSGDRLIAGPNATLGRDACFTAENLVFARGEGLPIDPTLVQLLRDAQPNRPGVDARAPFGTDAKGATRGLRGTFLTLSDPRVTGSFVDWLEANRKDPGSPPATSLQGDHGNVPRRKRCG